MSPYKPSKSKVSKRRKEHWDNVKETDLNPNAKEDFEDVLKAIFPPIKPKGVYHTRKRKIKKKSK